MTDALDFLTEAAREDRTSIEYRLQTLVLEISGRVHARLQQNGISQAELARLMGVSRPMITKLLTGDSNFQLRTLLRLASALEMELVVDLVPEGFRLPRFYVNREVADPGLYTREKASSRGDDVRRKKQIVAASTVGTAADYTLSSQLRVA